VLRIALVVAWLISWLLSWHCTSVTSAGHNRHGCYIKVGVTVTNVVFAVLCRKLYWLVYGCMAGTMLGLGVDLTFLPCRKKV
jgi:hypothetical protein